MSIALFGVDGLRYLDEQSDRNLVLYYHIELERISKGWYSTLSGHDKKKLIRFGILIYNYRGRYELSVKGQRLLYSIEQEHKN